MLQAERQALDARPNPQADRPTTVIGLIGPGSVGSRVLDRMARQASPDRALLGIANSTRMVLGSACLTAGGWRNALVRSADASCVETLAQRLADTSAERRILVDTTASPAVADRHAAWLERGLEVVTANKWAAAGRQADWPRLDRPAYRYATTVGAGLPILDTIRGLRRAGDRLLSIEGVLSGTWSYLTSQVAGGQGFADAVRDAHRLGLTEPDPRLDLSGVDVARKLVIAARAAGAELERDQVRVDSLVPAGMEDTRVEDFFANGRALQEHWQRTSDACPGSGETIVHLGRIDLGAGHRQARASVGLVRVDAGHPFARSSPGDNVVAIRTDTYREHPVWIRGPGAGADITALQVWADVVAFARH